MKRIMIDMDGVLAQIGINERKNWDTEKMKKGLFLEKKLLPGARDAVSKLIEKYDVYILSTPVWSNPECWKEKRIWIQNNFGDLLNKRLILAHNKSLIRADYLIDDSIKHGVKDFKGEHIHFGQENFPDWESVLEYLQQA